MIRLLSPVKELVSKGKLHVILASQSPRRSEILAKNVLGPSIPFEVRPSEFKEDWDKSKFSGRQYEYSTGYAKEKVKALEETILRENKLEGIIVIIGCDTVVSQHGVIFEKPFNESEAEAMLLSYSGRSHSVISGICVTVLETVRRSSDAEINRNDLEVLSREEKISHVETKVRFGVLDQESVAAYVRSGEPMDKAGGYGIQGLGASLVDSIEGCYFNVVGLPASTLSNMLASLLEQRLPNHV